MGGRDISMLNAGRLPSSSGYGSGWVLAGSTVLAIAGQKITVSGLNTTTDGDYIFYFAGVENNDSLAALSIELSGDTTTNHYLSRRMINATTSSDSTNYIGAMRQNGYVVGKGQTMHDFVNSLYPAVYCEWAQFYSGPTAETNVAAIWHSSAGAANITSISIVAGTTFRAGSYLYVFKRSS